MRRKTAFTLIELLVVIAIISLLISIMVPYAQKAKRQVQAIMCRHQLTQWGAAFSMYVDDYDGFNPLCLYKSYGNDGPNYEWYYSLMPYYQDPELLVCPATYKWPTRATMPFVCGRAHYRERGNPGEFVYLDVSYHINLWVSSYDKIPRRDYYLYGASKSPSWRWKRTDVKGANRVPYFGDCVGGTVTAVQNSWEVPGEFRDDNKTGTGTNSGLNNWSIDRHDCGINMLFMDWSVRKVGLKELWRLKWHRAFDTTAGPLEGKLYPVGWPEWMKNCETFEIKKKR